MDHPDFHPVSPLSRSNLAVAISTWPKRKPEVEEARPARHEFVKFRRASNTLWPPLDRMKLAGTGGREGVHTVETECDGIADV